MKTIEALYITIDIEVIRSDTFNKQLFILAEETFDEDGEVESSVPIDMTGWTFRMHIRRKPKLEATLAEFGNDLFYLGQSDEAIQYDIDEGNSAGTTKDEVYINVPAETMEIEQGTHYYDLELTKTDGEVKTPIIGRFKVIQDITR